MSRSVIKKTITLLVALIAVFTSLLAPATAYAYEDMDMTRNGNASLTLQLPAPSSNVKLYFVADMDAQMKITMKEEYKNLGVTLDDADSADDWAKKAELMSTQLIGSGIEPAVAATDDQNQAVFQNLSFGIYLVVVEGCKTDTVNYKVTPNFISVPNSTDGNTWIYDVSATLKYEAEPTPTPSPEKVKFVVKKLWEKDGKGATRPTEIKIKIMKRLNDTDPWTDVETVTLNSKNNWTYSWSAEADGSTWTIQELTTMTNYALSDIDTNEDADGVKYFVLTNRYLTPTPTPKVKHTPTPTPRTRITATPTPKPNITHSVPKTGDDQNILLPIIGVLAAGLVLVLLGMNIRKKSGKDE